MPETDRQRWDRKYSAGEGPAHFRPDPFLVQHCGTSEPSRDALVRSRRALDAACGFGGNALYLAASGFHVEAVDISAVALERARAEASRRGVHVDWVQADLKRWRVPAGRYDLVLVLFYLDRALLPTLAEGLRPGGLLFLAGRNRGHLAERPDFNPDFLWEPGEMIERVHTAGLVVIDACEGGSHEQHISRVMGRKPE